MGLNVSQIARYLNRHRSTVEERLRGAERIIDHSNAHKTRQRRRAIFQTDN
jgi:IS30 family transposase